jgi:hypothetical protein
MKKPARRYYSVRTGKHPAGKKLDLATLKKLFFAMFQKMEGDGYFQQHLGINCTDGFIPGKVGDVQSFVLFALRKDGIWPMWEHWERYSEADLFDMIELLHDHASMPASEGEYHRFNDCGYHYTEFDEAEGRQAFREDINLLLADYDRGYELDENGEIVELPDEGFDVVVRAPLPPGSPVRVEERVKAAVQKYRRYRATPEDRLDAVRDLAGALEYLRARLKGVLLPKDENDLFNIANGFAIRHQKSTQKTEYDRDIWLPWMFYLYLSTIHASIRLLRRREKDPAQREK